MLCCILVYCEWYRDVLWVVYLGFLGGIGLYGLELCAVGIEKRAFFSCAWNSCFRPLLCLSVHYLIHLFIRLRIDTRALTKTYDTHARARTRTDVFTHALIHSHTHSYTYKRTLTLTETHV